MTALYIIIGIISIIVLGWLMLTIGVGIASKEHDEDI